MSLCLKSQPGGKACWLCKRRPAFPDEGRKDGRVGPCRLARGPGPAGEDLSAKHFISHEPTSLSAQNKAVDGREIHHNKFPNLQEINDKRDANRKGSNEQDRSGIHLPIFVHYLVVKMFKCENNTKQFGIKV